MCFLEVEQGTPRESLQRSTDLNLAALFRETMIKTNHEIDGTSLEFTHAYDGLTMNHLKAGTRTILKAIDVKQVLKTFSFL